MQKEDQNYKLNLAGIEAARRVQLARKIFQSSKEQLEQYFRRYKLWDQNLLNKRQIFQSPKTKLSRTIDKIYWGQVQGKFKHGIGISIFKDGHIYQGYYKLNKKQGKGVQIYSSGSVYVGQFHQDQRHGDGTYFWFNFLPQNTGQQQEMHPPKPCLQVYKGKWLCNSPCGQGQIYKTNGQHYKGEFKNGVKHGRGLQLYPNGDIYQGYYVNGIPQGIGKYRWKNGQIYQGTFQHGQRSGTGIWRKKNNKQRYQGEFLLDKKHGKGRYIWEDGKVYQGNFWKDKMHGSGRLIVDGQQEQVYFEDGLVVSPQKRKLRHRTPQKFPKKEQMLTKKKECRRQCCLNNYDRCVHCH